jgi:hypothetical protein
MDPTRSRPFMELPVTPLQPRQLRLPHFVRMVE